MIWLGYICYAIILTALITSVYYSYKSRRAQEPNLRGLYTAKMNVGLGLLLITLAVIQLFLSPGSSIRVVVGVIFFLIGFFNLFAGIKNHAIFTHQSK